MASAWSLSQREISTHTDMYFVPVSSFKWNYDNLKVGVPRPLSTYRSARRKLILERRKYEKRKAKHATKKLDSN